MAETGNLAEVIERLRADKARLEAEEQAKLGAEEKAKLEDKAAYDRGYVDGVAFARNEADLEFFRWIDESDISEWDEPVLATNVDNWVEEQAMPRSVARAYRRGWMAGLTGVWDAIKDDVAPLMAGVPSLWDLVKPDVAPCYGGDFASTPLAPDAEQGGYVYLLVNLSMSDLVKIGQTTRDPRTRAQELGSVPGVPTPFTLVFDVKVNDPAAAEQYVHSRFAGMRVSRGREFFRVSPSEAVRVLLEAEKRYPLTKLTDRSGLGD